MLDSIDPSTMVLGIIFIISALFINTGLTRAGPFKDNKSVAGIISISIALFIIWAINSSGWNYYGFFNGIFFFIPTGFIETLWPLLALVAIVILGIWKKGASLFYIGGFLVLVSFYFDEGGGTLLAVGATLVILRIAWLAFFKKKDKIGYSGDSAASRSAAWAGKQAWEGTKWGWKKQKELRDPRERLSKYQAKQRLYEEKRAAEKNLRRGKKWRQKVNKRFWRRANKRKGSGGLVS